MHTLIILNPHAGGGKAGKHFQRLEPLLVETFDDFVVAVTETPAALAEHLDAAAAAGLTRIIAAGGDGTNHAVLNALAARPGLDLAFGSLPLGTGRDWARTLGVPLDPAAAVRWLGRAQPRPCDLGRIEYTAAGTDERVTRLFLNDASAGAGGEVAVRVNKAKRRTPFTFLAATAITLLQHKAQRVTVVCDGRLFYDGSTHLIVAANGQYFGRGMHPAPDARIDDGVFDVAVLEGVSKLKLLRILQLVYNAGHVGRPDVHFTKAAEVRITCHDGPMGLEFDGEQAEGNDLVYRVLPGAIRLLQA